MAISNNPNTNDKQPLHLPYTESISVPEAAAEWRRHGWFPVPVSRDRRTPYVVWSKGTDLSPDETRRQFEKWPGCLMAIALPSGIVVLDIDHRPKKGWDAGQALMRLRDIYGLPSCPTICTPRSGIHLWFSLPDGFSTRNWTSSCGRLPVDGVDVRTRGGLITVPPSERRDGTYAWVHWTATPPLAPSGLVRDLTPPREEPQELKAVEHPERLSAYVAAAYTDELAAVGYCREGGRNAQLFKSAAALGSLVAAGVLPKDHVFSSLFKAAEKCGLLKDDGARTVQATIRSGLRAGMSRPRQIPGAK